MDHWVRKNLWVHCQLGTIPGLGPPKGEVRNQPSWACVQEDTWTHWVGTSIVRCVLRYMDPFRVGTSLEACAQVDGPNCITVWAMLRLMTVGAHTLTLTLTLTHIPIFAYLDTRHIHIFLCWSKYVSTLFFLTLSHSTSLFSTLGHFILFLLHYISIISCYRLFFSYLSHICVIICHLFVIIICTCVGVWRACCIDSSVESTVYLRWQLTRTRFFFP